MVAAIAFESLVKLLAFVAVGVFVTFGMYDGFGDIFRARAAVPAAARAARRSAARAATTAPGRRSCSCRCWRSCSCRASSRSASSRTSNERHVAKAIWLFPLYLLAINVFVLPIAFAGLHAFPQGSVDADTFVLTLPMTQQQEALALFAFIGGLSAATGMVIVETIALSTMVCNDLVMPVLLRWNALRLARAADLTGAAARHPARRDRRAADPRLRSIIGSPAKRTRWCRSASFRSPPSRSSRPRCSAACTGRAARATGAIAGLAAGFLVWAYTLLLPSFAKSGWLPIAFVEQGLFGIELLKPQQLFGLAGLDDITHCAVLEHAREHRRLRRRARWLGRPSAREHTPGDRCSSTRSSASRREPRRCGAAALRWRSCATLVGRFLGPSAPRRRSTPMRGGAASQQAERSTPDAELVHFAEIAAGRRDRRRLGARDGRVRRAGGAARHRRGAGHPRRGFAGHRLQPPARAEVARARSRRPRSCARPTSG